MKLFLKIVLSIIFIAIIEIIIYLCFAFCYWDMLWPAACCGFARCAYLICSALGIAFSIINTVDIIDERYD